MSVDTYSIVVPVWGATHVDRFLDWVIPSWLSPSNIPDLAASAPVELILLTSKADHERIARHPTTASLAKYCTLRLVEIDDLIPGGIATVTLTLAFARGVATATADGNRPNIIFLNADFLLSEGSLASVKRRFQAGQQVLLCPSIRVIESRVMADLDRMRQPDGSMIVPAREAVRLALGALHPTVVACRIDQPLLQSMHPNQFFWHVDPTTLLLRAFLLFPLAVKPAKAPDPVDMYCDYGWIGTLAPDAPVDIMDKTDDFFAVELAPEGQELGFVRPGPADVDDIAYRISVWANQFSLNQPMTPLVFNAAEISQEAMDPVLAQSEAFVTDLMQRLGPAQPMSTHPYWIGGANAYLDNRSRLGFASAPVEMAKVPPMPKQDFVLNSRIRSVGVYFLLGRAGARKFWHPYHVAEGVMASHGPYRICGPARLAQQLDAPEAENGTPLAAINAAQPADMGAVVKALAATTAPGDRAYLVVGYDLNDFESLLGVEQRTAALLALDPYFTIVSTQDLVSDFETKMVARHRRLASQMHLVKAKRKLHFLIASAVALMRMTLANLEQRSDSPAMDRTVASVLVELRRRQGTGAVES